MMSMNGPLEAEQYGTTPRGPTPGGITEAEQYGTTPAHPPPIEDPVQDPTHIPTGGGNVSPPPVEETPVEETNPYNEGVVDEETMEYIRQNYPGMVYWLSIDDIRPLILEAATEGWSALKFKEALEQTDYWLNSNDARRVNQRLKQRDIGEWTRQHTVFKDKIAKIFARIGVEITPELLQSVSEDAFANAWNDSRISAEVMTYANFADNFKDDLPGSIDGGMVTLRKVAKDYQIPVSNEELWDMAKQIIEGESTLDAWRAKMVSSARTTYNSPELNEALDRGETVDGFLTPYKAWAANELGVSASSIDMGSAKWDKVLNYRDDSGTRRVMDLQEWKGYIRKDNKFGWRESETGKNTMAAAEGQLARIFGVRR